MSFLRPEKKAAKNSFNASKVPALHPSCLFVTRIRFGANEVGVHSVGIRLIDEDGNDMVPRVEKSMTAELHPLFDSGSVSVMLKIQALVLPRFGEYSVDVSVDGDLKASQALFLHPSPLEVVA
jgi:hypothetical protein